MRIQLLIPLLILGCLPACGEPDPPKPDAPLVLPDRFLGTWELSGTSGGLDGEGLPIPPGPKRPRIVLTERNTLERHAPDGAVQSQPFSLRRGQSIFSAEKQWMITTEGMELVLQITPDGTLSLSENVYDGYGSAYKRYSR